MEKPKVTKQLAFIAMLFVGVNFLLNVLAILFPELYFWLFRVNFDPELQVITKAILLVDAACVLPLGALCFWSRQQNGISENTAMGTLILAVICYFVQLIGSALLRVLTMHMANGASEIAMCSYINNARSYFSFCIIAALVMICCAASIELYITKSITSKS